MANELNVNPVVKKASQCGAVTINPWAPALGTVCVQGYGDIQGVSTTVNYYIEVFNTHQHALDDQTSIYMYDQGKPYAEYLPYDPVGTVGSCLILASHDNTIDQQGMNAMTQVCQN
jgi:hypothetical protein